MIKYDYSLKRTINNDEFKEFKPDLIPTNLPNMVLIEGPNSSGKSTLLNILAMSLYADKSEKLNPELKEKINGLKHSSHQKITFDIEVTDKKGGILLNSEKRSFEDEDVLLCEYVDGKKKPLTHRSFISKYNLIYDIPSNPTERIDDLVNELRDEQLRYGDKIKHISDYVSGILEEVENSRDPIKIEECRQKVTKCETRINELENELPTLNDFCNKLENYTYLRQYLHYYTELEKIESRIERLKAELKNTKSKRRKVSRKYNKLRTDTSFTMDKLSKIKNQLLQTLTPLFKKDYKHELSIWDDINIYSMKIEVDPKLSIMLSKFEKEIKKIIESMEEDSAYKNGMVYGSLIDILEKYTSVNIKIPKIDVTLSEILEIMKDEQKKYEEVITQNDHYKDILLDLKHMQSVIDDLNKLLNDLSNLENTGGDVAGNDLEYDETKELKLSSLEKDQIKAAKQLLFYEKMCIGKNIALEISMFDLKDLYSKYSNVEEISSYHSYKEEDLLNRINELKKKIDKTEEGIIHEKTLKELHSEELERLESVEEHPYELHKPELEKTLVRLRTLSSLFLGKYNESIRNIIRKDKRKMLQSDPDYLQSVFQYLGTRIGVFKHIDRDYTATYIDLIDRVIKTKENVTIHLADMGTGQSQSAYLRGLLNTPNDNRKIIALFDEVAMMDSYSLEPVLKRVRELYEEGRLLLCIVVQKADSIKVRDLME